ncbi:MAG: ABC transporter permease subunit [Vicinamibacterales bacterium]
MPIHDQGYRRYTGRRRPPGRGWRVIARSGIRAMLGRRAFVGLLIVAWLPFLVRAVQIYAATNLPQASFLAPSAETFRQFLGQQEVFLFFVAVYAGAGLIANDRRAHALQIYLSKPLTRAEYVIGKLGVLFSFLLAVSWLPAVLLLVVEVLFTGSFDFAREHLFLLPAITFFSWLEALVLSLAMLALSSLSRSSRYVAMLYAGVLFFSQALAVVLRTATGGSGLAWLSLSNSLEQIGNAVFGLRPAYDSPLAACLAAVLAVMTLSIAVLERRVRAVDVVA